MQFRLSLLTLSAALAGLGACGTSPDSRPATFEVVALSVLAPSCGQTQCHSTSTQLEGFAFDTLDATRSTLQGFVNVDAMTGQRSLDPAFMNVLNGDGEEQMPPDAPLAPQDIALIQTWIDSDLQGL